MTDYICVQFGHSNTSDQWYNVSTKHSTARAAERYGLDTMCIAGQFGFAVIEETKDTWKLLKDRSMLPPSGYSVGCSNTNIFVQPAPQLQLV